MAITVSAVDNGDEGEADLSIWLDEKRSRPDIFAHRKKIDFSLSGKNIIEAMVQVDENRKELEDLARVAFELGREYEYKFGKVNPLKKAVT